MRTQRGDAVLIFLAVMFLACGVALFFLFKALVAEEKKWQAFRVEHNCKIVGQKQGHTSIGSGVVINPSNGQPSTVMTTNTTPGQTGWLCDDGVTYWRNQ